MGTEETHFQDLQVRILAPGPEEVTAVFALRSRTFFLLVLGLKGVAKKKKELRKKRSCEKRVRQLPSVHRTPAGACSARRPPGGRSAWVAEVAIADLHALDLDIADLSTLMS